MVRAAAPVALALSAREAGAEGKEGSLSLHVVTRPGEGLGFRLAGVPVTELGRGEEAAGLRALLADPRAGVLAVEEEVLRACPEAQARGREGGLPVVLPFALPRRWGEAGRGREYLAALIRRAVGYHVRLGGEDGR